MSGLALVLAGCSVFGLVIALVSLEEVLERDGRLRRDNPYARRRTTSIVVLVGFGAVLVNAGASMLY